MKLLLGVYWIASPNFATVPCAGAAQGKASFQGALSAAIHAENGGGALTVTNAAHLPGRQGTSTDFGRVVTDPTAKSGPDGNAVNVDREASKIAANQVRYDVLARLVQGELSGLAWAANDGRNG